MLSKNTLIILIITCLLVILTTLYAIYILASNTEITETMIIEEQPIDNRISPLENQGILIEINRIRHRGLLKELITAGSRKWKIPPQFYYTINIDGVEINSKDASGLGAKSTEQLFNTWDTIFQENKIPKDVEEEQETSNIKISLVERETQGILGLRNQDITKETLDLVYDYRTGRWTGDDYFKDNDGYGHYLGQTFELWFNIYQTGKDSDTIPYWVEVNILHSNPSVDDSKLDPDNDGIPTTWEWKWGYNPNTWDDHQNLDPDIDGLENIEEYQMAKYFADPYSQDIYIEVDGMQKGGFLDPPHILWEESKQGAIERFSEHNIRLYIDNGWPGTPENAGGELLQHYQITVDYLGMMEQYYIHHFPDERKGIFHYVVIGHGGGYSYPMVSNKYDTTHLGYNFIQMIRPLRNPYCIPTPRAWRVHLGAMLLHETGHTLGIYSPNIEGNDNHSALYALNPFNKEGREYKKTWAQYYSVMNYYWTTMMDWFKVLFDYSDGSNGLPYDYNDWEYFYLPYFQMEASMVEDIDIMPPAKDRLINENLTELYLTEWRFDEKLSQTHAEILQNNYEKNITISEPLANGITWRIYIQNNTTSTINNSSIKIYGQPKIPLVIDPYAGWSLIWEGTITPQEKLNLYNQQQIIDDIQNNNT